MERSLSHIALFAALIAVLGFVPQIMLPFGVPITALNSASAGSRCSTALRLRRLTTAMSR